ncbi:MAG TPA: hypothetical protein VF521_11375, partial [Pyrinomonadaceae bacterium]
YTRLRRMLLDNFAAPAARRSGPADFPEPPTAERLDRVKAPTLVVIGGEDAPNLKNIADTLARGIPGAREATIPGASHHPPVETPAKFNRVLLDFLKRK